jgi:2-hydroxychromene-2-carboxylate isomerase
VAKTIDYYFSPASPWTYFGHARFAEIARKHGATIAPKPVDFGRIFPLSGGVPVAKRPPQRQAYRMAELERWRKHLEIPLNLEPKFFPFDARLAALAIVATGEVNQTMKLIAACLRACWAEEKNMADENELTAVIRASGLDSSMLLKQAQSPEIVARYEAFTDEAIARNVFGAPTYLYRNELFWGQDRLDFLDRALAATSP